MRTERRWWSACVLVFWSAVAVGHGSPDAFSGGGHDHDEAPAAEAPNAPDAIHVDSRLIRVAPVEARQVVEHRAGIGRVVMDASGMRNINAFISGQVREVLVRPGTHVSRNDPIARIYSPEFIRTQKAYLALLDNKARLETLRGEGRLPNYLKGARDNLRWWGMSDREIERLEQSGETVDVITVRAGVDGIITEVLVQPGDLINAGDRSMAKFVVTGRVIARAFADQEPFWLEANLFPSQTAGIRGKAIRVLVTLPGGKTLERSLHNPIPAMSGERQLARVMVKLGQSGELYLGQPLRFELLIERPEPVWMPRAALMGHGLAEVVFVRTGPDSYDRRRVRPGAAVGEWVPVPGLEPGTSVVIAGKMLLDGAYRLAASQPAGQHGDDHHH